MKSCCCQLTAALFLALAFTASATPRYVDVNSNSPASPYTDWNTAATNIQDAIDVADPGDQILVTNGVYQSGTQFVTGVETANRLAVTKAVTVQSINGPAATVIVGNQVPGTTNGSSAVRCVYLTNGAALIGFTLTNGATVTVGTFNKGGGILFKTVLPTTSSFASNCVLTGNSADFGGGGAYGGGTLINCTLSNNWARLYGGGTYGPTLNFCRLIGNSTRGSGGGALGGTLNNCLIVSNSASDGGGVYSGTLNNCTVTGNKAAGSGGGVDNLSSMRNCIVYFNFANGVLPVSSNYWDSPMAYCCTAPSAGGTTSITNAPLFVDQAGGDYHLQSNSPCINAGNNTYAPTGPDLDGKTRIMGGTVDMGAYECQSPALLNYYTWLQGFGLPTTASEIYTDTDGDGMNNWQEWRADTVPTNALSIHRMVTVTNGTPGLQVTWESVPTRTYWLDCATNLASLSLFSAVASNIVGQVVTTTYTDTTATNGSTFFYRVGVQQ
jgi:hypothetical protein